MSLVNVQSEMKPRDGVLVLTGFGLRIAVDRGHLVLEDGVGRQRRSGRFPRVGGEIKRLVVVGHAGSVSLEALRWLHEIGVAFVQIGADGELIAMSVANVLTDARLRRAQALAIGSDVGISIARMLLLDKVVGQARVLDRINGHRESRQVVGDAIGLLGECKSVEQLRFVESRAAAAYWSAWEFLPVNFAGKDAKHVPTHWRTAGTRRSILSSSPRKAATPVNAILNYLYTILEAEARLAALAVGCDPALGVIHSDKPSRDSLACDLMEPVRPAVDDFVLSLIESHTFGRTEFFETREGNCRLMPELTRPLGTSALRWAQAIAPIAEQVGGAFLRAPLPTALPVNSEWSQKNHNAAPRFRTPLTGRNRSRRNLSTEARVQNSQILQSRCRDCGSDLNGRNRVYCDSCLPTAAKRASAKGAQIQRDLRALGMDGRSSDGARRKHRDHALRSAGLKRKWESEHELIPSPVVFRERIGPHLVSLSVQELAKATGLSISSCKKIRGGVLVPHPMHWDSLERLIRDETAPLAGK
jgi:CRISPR-associated endonuclease Cas1